MKKYRIIIIVGVIALIGLFLPNNFFQPIKNLFYQATTPFSVVGNVSTNRVSLFFKNFTHLVSLSYDNERLIKENLELQSQLSILKEAQHESEVLKKELGFLSNKGEMKLTPANVIARPLNSFLKNIIIDRGSKDGVNVGQAVVSQGFLVGIIKQVNENNSEVTLINNYNSLVPVLLQDSRGTGLLRGGISGLVVEDIPLNITIKKGEQVVSSGLGGDMPSSIAVGQVQDVVSKEGEIFQKVTVKSPIQFYYLEFVFVVQK
ncbi:MAG: Cell shape-determining protein MreC [Berkelbacteria bacterium GW2011_GWB1_38_5]|uniref:Cell shape-determining protein MreC n=2 Tax=Candidatus Berkelbacteria TaxID=1618330 RepID=A0A0G0NXZ2_9BACT|nr:MAG: Cell shape-determining protein MreC [Berkelbacteria bacterium GW2011_GWB1_38_5]KKQ90679.1 MAG: Cell shape-determining protein MreC [Berkelbacteria bacterium GW2011_GWA1_39_10]